MTSPLPAKHINDSMFIEDLEMTLMTSL